MTATNPNRRWRKIAMPFVLLLIVIAFFWKLLLTNQYSWLQSPDLAFQVLPWFQYEASQFHRHVFPLWDPFQFAGQSLIGQDQPGLAYPLNWILFSLPLHDGHINIHYLNWYYMSIHYFAALFCYWLCRDLGRGQLASLIAGLSFGLGGYVGGTDWPQIINGAIWAPLVFLFLFRALRGVRPLASAALSGMFLGVSWLSGHHLAPLFATLAACGVWLYSFFEGGHINRRVLAPAGVFLIFVVLASAFQVWPTISYAHTAVRWVGSAHDPISWNSPVPYSVHQLYSLNPRYLLGIVIPGFEEGGSVYVGVVALVLAGLALAHRWQTKEVRLLSGIGIAGLLFALGSSNVLYGIFYSIVPMIEKAREPMNAICLFHFAIAVLIAYGMDAMMKLTGSDILRRAALITVGFGTVAFLIVFGVFLANGQKWTANDRVMITVFAAFAVSGLVYRMSRAQTFQVGLSVLMAALYLFELGNSGALYALPHRDDAARNVFLNRLDEPNEVVDFLRHQPGPIRVWTNTEDVPFNLGDWYGIDALFGYAPSAPANYWQIEPFTVRGRQIYATAWTISRKPVFGDQKEIFRGSNGLAVYRNPDVMPRVWTVHDSVQVHDPADARRHLQDAAFDLKTRTFTYAGVPPMEKCTGDEVRSWSRGIDETKTTVTMKCRGMVVMSENNDPGWIALVDGRAAPVYDAYTTLRGVIADPGTHTIELRYRPLSVKAGVVATLLAFFGAVVIAFRARRESVPPADPREAQY